MTFFAVLLGVMVLAMPVIASAWTPLVQRFPICTASGNQISTAISGNTVVWQDDGLAGQADIYGYDLATKTAIPICSAPGRQIAPEISGDTVVWVDYRGADADIYGYDLVTRTESPICTAPYTQYHASISDNIVVWEDDRALSSDIWGYDLATKTEFPICTASGSQTDPVVSGNTIVWVDDRSGDFRLHGYDLATKREFLVGSGVGGQLDPAISGNVVVWDDFRTSDVASHIYGYDLSRQVEFAISPSAANVWAFMPTVSGNLVAWYDDRNGGLDIYGYDLSRKVGFPVCLSPGLASDPAISGDYVVWEDTRNGASNSDIYGARIIYDTVGPVCAARSVTVSRNHSCRLWMDIDDNFSTKATVTLWIRTRSGRTLKKWTWSNLKLLPAGDWYWMRYTCRLARGRYVIRVTAIDQAGNRQSKTGLASLTVR